MRASAADWQLLNAYSDGELAPDETAALEVRLREEPDLVRALNRIRAVKRELKSLCPAEATVPEPANTNRVSRVMLRAAAVAAVIVIALGLGAGLLVWRGSAPMWVEQAERMHGVLSHNAYVVEERPIVQLVSTGTSLEFHAPDLTASHLYLVDIMTSDEAHRQAIALHYRGMRGCRLTIVAIEAAGSPDRDDNPADGTLIADWSYGGFRFAVIAQGMDADRFASVADYAQAAIAESVREEDDLRVAMADRYQNAQPCV